MADDKMKQDDLNKNLGGQQGSKQKQQSPGRNQQDDEQFGQRGGGQGSTGNRGLEDDEMGQGGGTRGGSNPGGQSGQKNPGSQGGQNR